MKTILFSLLVIAAIPAFAQQRTWFAGVSVDSARAIAHTIAGNAHTHFEEVTEELDTVNRSVYVTYKCSPSKTKPDSQAFYIRFQVFEIGGNKDVGVIGKQTCFFQDVRGLYLDVFSFWKSYVDSSADAIATSQKRFLKKVVDRDKELAALMDKNSDEWRVYVH